MERGLSAIEVREELLSTFLALIERKIFLDFDIPGDLIGLFWAEIFFTFNFVLWNFILSFIKKLRQETLKISRVKYSHIENFKSKVFSYLVVGPPALHPL